MTQKEIVNKIKPELEKVISFLDRELQKIRGQRASSALVEDLQVDCFGKTFPLSQLAMVSVPGPREIVIQPWDKSYIEPIVNAFSHSGISMSPVVDKDLIRVNLPPLSEEFRKDLVRLIAQKQEEGKKTLRRLRDSAWSEIQDRAREGKIREDDKYKGKDELQDLIDDYNKKIEEIGEKKKKEIMG